MSILMRALGRTASVRLAAGFFAAVAAVLPCAASAHGFKVGSIAIGHPWSRATPPGATTGAAYLKLSNEGAADDRLVSVTSPVAARAQVHEMRVENGVMTMRPHDDGLAIPAGETVVLKPGGLHIMLLDLKTPLKAGDDVPATLTFAKAGKVDVTLRVEALGARNPGEAATGKKPDHDMGGGHAGHDMGSMGK